VASRHGHFAPTESLSLETASLIEQRGMDADLCERLGIVTARSPDGGSDWIAIPFVRNGAVVNWKFRRVIKDPNGPNFSQQKGGKQCWWNHDALLDKTLSDLPLVVCEGEMDALVAIQCGLGRVVSVPGGAPSQEVDTQGNGKYGFVADTMPLLAKVREIVLAVDGDGPGMALLNDLGKRLGRGRCKFIDYPPGCKDLNEVLQLHGQAGVVRCIAEARYLDVPGIHTMGELPPLSEAAQHVIGIAGLHEHFRMRLGDFSVLTGVPGSGKSTIVNDIACRMARRHQWHVTFASPEQVPQTDHRRALRTWCNSKPADEQTPGELEIADEFIEQNFAFVVGCDDEDFDLDWLLDKFATAVIRYDTKLCVIDPWNELDVTKPRDMTTTEYVGKAIRQLKKFAKTWQVHVLLVAHPIKMLRGKDGIMPRPTLYDIADSANFYNKPDVGMILHPSVDLNGGAYTALIVAKSRYHDRIGKPGEVRLRLVERTARYEAA
jgi:twinkle protein